MKIQDIYSATEVVATKNTENNIDITGIAYHTQDVKPGFLFVALKGAVTDGHKYISKAIEKGAAAVLLEDFSPLSVPQVQVVNARKALAEVSAFFYNYPAKKLITIGVTATNGKTTTCYMIEKILQAAGKKTGVIGSIGVRYGDKKLPSPLTTPESLDIQRYLNIMLNEGIEAVMIESSSNGLEAHRLDQLYYSGVTYHNLALDHLAQHGTYENYAYAKGLLLTKVATKHTLAVIEMDNPDIAKVKNNTKAKVYGISFKGQNAHYYLSDVIVKESSSSFVLHCSLTGEEIPIQLFVPGAYNVMNAAMAASLAKTMGFDHHAIAEGLKNYKGSQRRFEKIYEEHFRVYDDECSNENNLRASLDNLSRIDTQGKLHILYGFRGNRGVEVNRDNALVLARKIKELKPASFFASKSTDVVGKNDLVHPEEEVAFKEIMDQQQVDYRIFENLTSALKELLDVAEKDDVILMLGAQALDDAGALLLQEIVKKNPSPIAKASLAKVKERV